MMEPQKFEFALEDEVELVCSREAGVVIGYAMHLNAIEPSYRVRYVANDGRLVESWWDQGALMPRNG